MTENVSRQSREARIRERVSGLSEEDLAGIEIFLALPGARTHPPGLISRRQALAGVAVGSLSLALGGVGGVAAGTAWGDAQGAARERAAADQEIARLRGLVKLYEDLEKIGIDALLNGAMSALEAGLKGVKDGITGLRGAVSAVGSAAADVESTMDGLRSGLAAAEGFVSLLGGQVKLLQSALYEVTGRVGPVADAIGAFLSDLISKIPFGAGDRILAANTRLRDLVGGLPSALDGISRQLLAPLHDDWLSDDESRNLKGRLITPLRQNLLKPTIRLLDDAAAFLAELESRLFTPTRSALADRARVSDQITRYRASLGMS